MEAENRARERWSQWRLLLSDMNITYTDLMIMDDEDIAEANAALDLYQKLMDKQTKKS
ncbi:hypothetical protein [Paenibacillus shirakamiensis]|uniref:hypothetical protein n=1 Tax=Paenibacillus shirakamiensis TaxID=1265935 RepID=UPI001AE1745A|nr:hypothetical protein [Paenibacillus shirakamiensis]